MNDVVPAHFKVQLLTLYSTKTHTICRRCNNRSFHRQHKSAYSESM